jgi:hypothetical protein
MFAPCRIVPLLTGSNSAVEFAVWQGHRFAYATIPGNHGEIDNLHRHHSRNLSLSRNH